MQSRNRDTDTENKRMDIKEIKGRWDESGDWDWHEYTIDFFVVVVQSLSRVWLFMTPWTTAHQASLSFTISRSLLKFMSIELVMLSNHLILWCPFSFCLQSFPESGSFPVSKLFISGGQSFGASASASVLPVNIQGWFPLGLTGLISLLSKGLLKSLLQHHSLKPWVLQHSAFLMV